MVWKYTPWGSCVHSSPVLTLPFLNLRFGVLYFIWLSKGVGYGRMSVEAFGRVQGKVGVGFIPCGNGRVNRVPEVIWS